MTDVPENSGGDAAHSLVRACIESVPFVGAAGSELFSFFIKSPIENRRNEWMRQVGERLHRLECVHGVSLESLQEDEEFLDTILQATGVALRSSKKEKHTALLNAIMNSTSTSTVDSANRQMYLYLIDSFTEWHIRVLKLFANPREWFEDHKKEFDQSITMGSIRIILCAAYPELENKRSFYDQVWRDLFVAGLTNTESLHASMTGHGLFQSRTTDRGEELLLFIEKPCASSTSE